MVLVAADEVVRSRGDLDEVGRVPRAAQRDRLLAEERIHLHRLVGLAGPAFLGLLDQADHGRVAFGKRLLVREVGARPRGDEERGRGQHEERRSGAKDRRACSHTAGFRPEELHSQAA